MCGTELDKDDEELYFSDPEGSYTDAPIVDDECLGEYNREVEQNERRNLELQNRFDRIIEPANWYYSVRSISHLDNKPQVHFADSLLQAGSSVENGARSKHPLPLIMASGRNIRPW